MDLKDDPFVKAAILVQLARDRKFAAADFKLDYELDCYKLRHKYHFIFRIAAWGLILIHIFERPFWTYSARYCDKWDNHDLFPSFGMGNIFLPVKIASSLNLTLLGILCWCIYLELFSRPPVESQSRSVETRASRLYASLDSYIDDDSMLSSVEPVSAVHPALQPRSLIHSDIHAITMQSPNTHSRLSADDPLLTPVQMRSEHKPKELSLQRFFPSWPLMCLILIWLLKTCEEVANLIVSLGVDEKSNNLESCLFKVPFTTSPMEALFVLLIEKSYSSALAYLARSLPHFSVLATLVVLVVLCFAALGR